MLEKGRVMKMMKSKSIIYGCVLGSVICPTTTLSAPGALSDKPLFLSSGVQPNILLLLDDSGSMDWEVLLTNDALEAHENDNPVPPNSGSLDFTPNDDEERHELCFAYNSMAYDPSKTYTPWVGVDNVGNAFVDMSLTAARRNPYDPTTAVDISSTYYYGWNDSNSDGAYQSGECSTADSNRVFASGLTSAEKINYANWFSYYRKREYVMKRAVSQIIDRSRSRMGLATLWNHGGVATEVKDIDTFTPLSGTPQHTTALANKNTLVDNLFMVSTGDGTPLRKTLEEAGKYFEVGQNTKLFGNPSPSSPILPSGSGGQCQQNFSVLLSDGFWNGGDPSVGNTDSDGTGPYDGGSYADTYSNTLADVAMHYYERDLATSIPDKVRTVQALLDDNPAQHMVTYTVAFGVNGNLTDDDMPTSATDTITWPQPVADTLTTVDDMRHAAWNGRGLFLNAGKPDELISSLQAAIQSIGERQGSASAVSFNSTSITQDTRVFQAKFDTDGWNGSLQAFPFDATTGAGSLDWDAGVVLRQRDLALNPRQIITSSGINSNTKGIPFTFPADYTNLNAATDLSASQINDLLFNAPYAPNTAVVNEIAKNQSFGKDIVDYLRGDATCESGCSVASPAPAVSWQFRSRNQDISGTLVHNILGDIIHSSPQFVGVPDVNYPDLIEGASNKYSTFVTNQSSRQGMVYVGSNDGMLHGFNADNGQEVFAYVPFAMFSNQNKEGLHYLAQQDYGHKPYVDGSPFSTDVFIGGQWRTYLVSGYQAGGKGIFVLDVTNPTLLTEANANNIVKLEFTHSDLGYTFSRPLIGKMNNGKWAAIFGNGYNSTGDGRAKLFIVYLDGSGYVLLDTKQGSITNSSCTDPVSDCNGLSSPTILDISGDAIIDRVYAGDLFGNMWVFDVSDPSATNWGVAYDNGGLPPAPQPLFQACTSNTNPCPAASRQPITTRPAIAVHPQRLNSSTDPNLMVYFGTGQYIANGDEITTGQQSMYGIWDAGASNADLRRANLQVQTISSTTTTVSGNPVVIRDLSTNQVNYDTGAPSPELGWYVDLPLSKERIVVDPLISDNVVFFNTIIPNTFVCQDGGDGFIMFADRLTGGRASFPVLDLNNDGTIDSNDLGAGHSIDALPSGSRIIDGVLATSDSSGDILDEKFKSGFDRKSKRTSWSHAR